MRYIRQHRIYVINRRRICKEFKQKCNASSKISFLDIDGEWKEYDFMNSSSPSHLTGNLWKWNNDELEGRVLYDHPKFKIYLEKSDFHIDIDLNMTLSFSGRIHFKK